jgi:eukaryotic-like serine/threonine-protein kinase
MDADGTAIPLFREAIALYQQADVDQPAAAASAMSSLANVMANGTYPAEETEQLARRALELHKRHAPGDAEAIAMDYTVLSLPLLHEGNYDEAEAAAQSAIDLRTRNHMPELDSASAWNNLAMIASRRGDADKAIATFRHIVDIRIAAGESETGSMYITLSNYGVALNRAERSADAAAIHRRALGIAQKIWGDDSDMVEHSTVELATSLASAGDYAEVQPLLDRGAALCEKLKGSDNGDCVNVTGRKADFFATRGEMDRAIPLMRDVLDYRIKHLAPDDNRTLRAKEALATALLQQGHADEEARSLLEEVIAALKKKAAPGVDLQYALISLANWNAMTNHVDAAQSLLDEAQAEKNLTAGNQARVVHSRAAIARSRGDVETAVREDERALSIYRDQYGETHPHTARYMLWLASDLGKASQLDRAAKLKASAQPIFDQAFPADSVFRHELDAVSSIR